MVVVVGTSVSRFLHLSGDALCQQMGSDTGLRELGLLLRDGEADPASPGRRQDLDEEG